jgi:hypothetical protein
MLFGEYLTIKGYCTDADIQRALDLQNLGDKRLIGRILLDMGAVTWEQIEEAITAMAPQSE